MIKIKNVKTVVGDVITHTIPSEEWKEIDAEGRLHLLPAMIDPHISLGSEGSEQWNLSIDSIIRGGITSIIEIPHEFSTSNMKKELEDKNRRVESILNKLDIPLNYSQYLLYSDSKDEELDVSAFKKSLIKGAVIHLEHHHSNMTEKGWENLFRLAAQEDIPIILNSFEGDSKKKTRLPTIEKAIKHTESWSNRLYILNVASQREIDLIQEGQERSLLIYAETNPKHLFSGDNTEADCLWKALNAGVIETLGSGFSLAQKSKDKIMFRGREHTILDPRFLLPLLLTAFRDKGISLEQFTQLTSTNIQNILEFEKNQDCVLVDLEKEDVIQKVRNGSSVDHKLIGWPVYTVVNGQVFVS
ncbi:MAG: hypothetical protein H0W50_03840 [Parachlamydiaceae bacterium]|nr:hypothetical protein [Parachlamydiaceae bacterium]